MAAIDRDFGRCRFSAVYYFFNYFPKAIAKRLNISLGRAKNIAMRVYEKLGVHSKKALPGLVW